jgi:hypothetical protein
LQPTHPATQPHTHSTHLWRHHSWAVVPWQHPLSKTQQTLKHNTLQLLQTRHSSSSSSSSSSSTAAAAAGRKDTPSRRAAAAACSSSSSSRLTAAIAVSGQGGLRLWRGTAAAAVAAAAGAVAVAAVAAAAAVWCLLLLAGNACAQQQQHAASDIIHTLRCSRNSNSSNARCQGSTLLLQLKAALCTSLSTHNYTKQRLTARQKPESS